MKYIFWRPESVQVAQGARREGEAHWRSTQLTARHNTCPPDRTKNKEKLKHNQEKDFGSGMWTIDKGTAKHDQATTKKQTNKGK